MTYNQNLKLHRSKKQEFQLPIFYAKLHKFAFQKDVSCSTIELSFSFA